MPLANQQERLHGSVELSPSSTRPAPVYLLHLSGSTEVTWLEALQSYALLRSMAAEASSKKLRQLQAQLRQRAGSYLAPYVAFQYLRRQPSARPLLDSLTTRFAREQPTSPYLPRLRELLEKAPALAVGELAPDFTLADQTGKLVALSSLRGRYVLVDFWASWCKPCRAENPNLVKAYAAYQARGFTVLSISVDNEKQRAAWLKAIRNDGLSWPQASDLLGMHNGATRSYGVVTVPQNFLIDPQGRIVATNLTGEALTQKLTELLSPAN